jgi:glycosyltransferase involved in cell wall biosynthesis
MSEQPVQKRLCAVIPTKDNIRTIQECLESILPVTQDIIVVEWCEKLGVKVIHRPWPGMVKQRQFCLEQAASFDWILILDSDEMLDAELQNAINQVCDVATDKQIEGFTFNRKVWFMGGWLHHVFQPEPRLRVVSGAGWFGRA